jgi:hypothetical protein
MHDLGEGLSKKTTLEKKDGWELQKTTYFRDSNPTLEEIRKTAPATWTSWTFPGRKHGTTDSLTLNHRQILYMSDFDGDGKFNEIILRLDSGEEIILRRKKGSPKFQVVDE